MRSTAGTVPDAGQLIAIVSTRQAWRVIRVDDVHQANWHDVTVRVWEKAGRPDPETWPGRERAVLVEPPRNQQPNGKGRRGIRLSLWWHGEQWLPLTDPYPACVDCGLLWPCPCDDANKEAASAMSELDRLGAIMPGCCWACSQPIAGRQHSIVFDGDNLLLPGGGPVAFHTAYSRKAARGPSGNQTCRGEAEAYEKKWLAAEPGRVMRLRCPGTLYSHFGYRECTEAQACPGEGASHRNFHHCTSQVFLAAANYRPDSGIHPDELRPPTYCGGKGCRGLRAATAEAA